MADNNKSKITSWIEDDRYVEPSNNTYTELRHVSDNYRKYDDLKTQPVTSKQRASIGVKCWVVFIVVLLMVSAVTAGLTYIIVYFTRQDNLSQCRSFYCGLGQCYLDKSGFPKCICPEEKTGANCEQNIYRVSEIRQSCPVDWIEYESYCYKTFLEPKTWFQSRDFCRGIGSELVSIKDEGETIFLVKNFAVNDKMYWIGLRHLETEGKFIWTDGSEPNYTNWFPGEPNNLNNREQCVHLFPDFPGKWNDNNCYMSRGFICKLERTSLCGSDFLYFNNSCYSFHVNSSTVWYEAREACVRSGSDLAIIRSQMEYHFILGQVTKSSNDAWIGLSDRENVGIYKWVDGSLPNFFTWNIGEPDNQNHRCVKILSIYGNWDDSDCTSLNGYICQRKLS